MDALGRLLCAGAELPCRRRRGADGALERQRRPGRERAGDHHRTGAVAGGAANQAEPGAARPAADAGAAAARGATAQTGRDGGLAGRTEGRDGRCGDAAGQADRAAQGAEKKPRQVHASLASAPSSAEQRAERAAAPAPGASARDANALPNWRSLLVATLERNKRYPAQAQERGEHGTAELAFSVDRHGGVHRARILRSSGSSLLDSETLAMLERAAPLPPPPVELGGGEISIVVPIRYNIR